jgi:ATP-dependent protease ClpP protease subunit
MNLRKPEKPSRREFLVAVGAGVGTIAVGQAPQQIAQVGVKKATIRFTAQITSHSMGLLMNACTAQASKGVTQILLQISSNGGILDQALTAYNVLRAQRSVTFSTYNIAVVDSAAVVLFSLGAHGHRFSVPLGRFLLHSPFVPVMLSEFRVQNADAVSSVLKQQSDALNAIIHFTTGRPIPEIESWMQQGVAWEPTKAVANGLLEMDGVSEAIPVEGDLITISDDSTPNQQIVVIPPPGIN